MRAIVTSDWQVTWGNLDKCEATLKHILELKDTLGISTLIHCGDLKHHYSPVDVRVVNFGVHFVRVLKAAKMDVVILLGNHDRVSMSNESENWFPALQAAGAITVDSPLWLTRFGFDNIAAVPFMADAKEAKKVFAKLAKRATKDSILLFHNELSGCRLNVASKSVDKSLSLADLKADRYGLCLGGHIHLHQRMSKNCYFVGSPFAQDWGEANQRKGLVVVDGNKVSLIESKIPGMYDPSLPGFDKVKPSSWVGASVRVHVVFDKDASIAYQPFIDKSLAAAVKKYPGADITVVPEFLDAVDKSEIASDGSDTSIIKAYVAKTHTGSTSEHARVAAYLQAKLEKYGVASTGGKTIEAVSATAKNFLCFESAEVEFKKGITVVTGRNDDWPGRNNGSGKTSLMQLPAVALFGKTLKGQEANALVRRGSDKKSKSYVEFKFKIGSGKLCKVHRSRRPVKLKFSVGSKDHAVGMGSKGTQEEIQRLTGLSWESVRDAMYIDQGAVSKVLSGTDTERKAIFSKFIGLERYELARKDCAEALSSLKKTAVSTQDEVEEVSRAIATTKATLKDFQQSSLKDTSAALAAMRSKLQAAESKLASARKSRKRVEKLQERISRLQDLKLRLAKKVSWQEAIANVNEEHADEIKKLSALSKTVCPTCKQPVSAKHLNSELKHYLATAEEAYSTVKILKKQQWQTEDRIQELLKEAAAPDRQINAAMQEVHSYEVKVLSLEKELAECKKSLAIRKKYKAKLSTQRKQREQLQAYLTSLQEEIASEAYCVKAFSRDGMPAFIVSSIVPRLNAAAKKYSKLFSEDEIKVRFITEGSDIDVELLNLHGGESLKDQSAGETRIAGIITGFAVRDVINPSNLLVLDEPGESLDEMNAKVFAEGLREAAKSLGCVMITTHNPFILGELRGERLVEVVKRNGVSIVK